MKYVAAPGSCETFSYGEVEDYTANIISTSVKSISFPIAVNSEPSNDEPAKPSFDIYPNPAGNKLYINLTGASSISLIRIFDIHGKELQVFVNHEDNSLDIAKLASGIYIIMIVTDNGKFEQKFIKQ